MRTTRHRRLLGVIGLWVVASVIPLVSQQNPDPASADSLPPVAVLIRGRGNGHGRGMSQFGALGWATKLNYSWQDILNFYYGGGGRTLSTLTQSDAALTRNGAMTVRLTTLDTKQTAVISDNVTASWQGQPETYGALVAQSVGKNVYDIYGSSIASCPTDAGTSTTMSRVATAVPGPIDFVSTNGAQPTAVAPTDLLGVCEPATTAYRTGRVRYYRGGVRAITDKNGALRTVNVVALESYLRGVIPRESPAGWGDLANGLGMNALRAQAVAARSYSLSESRYSYAKTCDSQDCQVYGGAALKNIGATTVVIEDPRTDRAIGDTAGSVYRDSKNSVMRTEYTSSNGGRTASGQFDAKSDDGDLIADAALQTWSKVVTATQVQKIYPSIGVLMSITTTHDGLGGEWNGYATSVAISGTAGMVTRTGWQFRGDFDLYAPWFETVSIPASDATEAPVGSILYIGDSVSEGASLEIATIVTPAYPNINFQACAGRGMAGLDCRFPVKAPQLDLDGVGVVNSSEAPAIAIIKLGYNDDPFTFSAELSQMISALTSKGVQRIIFITMSTRSTLRSYAIANAALLAAANTNPAITIFDWNAASSLPNQWRYFNNSSLCCWVHLSNSGQNEFALFLRQQLDNLRAQGLLPTTAAQVAVIPGLPIEIKHSGVMVRTVQKRLNSLLPLTKKTKLRTDGVFGRGTLKAVKTFQLKSSLPVTGIVDRSTWAALGLENRLDLAVFKVGSKQPAVSSIQRALSKVLKTKIATTGKYSPALAASVKTFQQRAKLPATGRVGPSTWAMLMAAAALS